MLSQLVILQFLCDTQTHQPRTHLSQSRAQLPLLAQGKRKILHSISVSFLTLLFIHSYNNYPWVKEYGQAAPTDHRAWLPRIEHIWDYSEVDARFYFSTFISNTKHRSCLSPEMQSLKLPCTPLVCLFPLVLTTRSLLSCTAGHEHLSWQRQCPSGATRALKLYFNGYCFLQMGSNLFLLNSASLPIWPDTWRDCPIKFLRGRILCCILHHQEHYWLYRWCSLILSVKEESKGKNGISNSAAGPRTILE